MPEWGMLPIPRKLVKQGVRDMLRMSDARMSGTSYGACVLHVAPESYRRRSARLRAERRSDRGRCRGAQDPSRRSPTRRWRNARPPGSRRRRATSAATARCSPRISGRPTRAAISISSPRTIPVAGAGNPLIDRRRHAGQDPQGRSRHKGWCRLFVATVRPARRAQLPARDRGSRPRGQRAAVRSGAPDRGGIRQFRARRSIRADPT